MSEKEGVEYQGEKKFITLAEEKQKLLQLSEISLLLNTYNDLFSSFDPRPYARRALSGDFLDEIKRASLDKKSGDIELKFMVPSKMRDLEEEKVIKKRLHEHFRKHLGLLRGEVMGIIKGGIILTVIGLAMMLSAAYVKVEVIPTIWSEILFVILEPAGWFMAWYGLDEIFYSSASKKMDLTFYEKMVKRSKINFYGY